MEGPSGCLLLLLEIGQVRKAVEALLALQGCVGILTCWGRRR